MLGETELSRPCVTGKGVQMRCWQRSHPLLIALRCPDSTGLFSEQTHFSGRQAGRQQTEALFHSHNTEKCSSKLNWEQHNKNLQQFPLLRTSENTKRHGIPGGTICSVDLLPFEPSQIFWYYVVTVCTKCSVIMIPGYTHAAYFVCDSVLRIKCHYFSKQCLQSR